MPTAEPRRSLPMISCILATRNRHRFLPQALRCFARQTYRNSELIVVDDSDRPAARLCRDLPRVRYIRLTRPTPTGTKLNIGIEAARGEIIQKLDDDDFYRADFLAASAAHMPRRGLRSTIVTRCCFLVLSKDRPALRHSGHGWNPGGTFCFHRSLVRRQPFRDVPRSVDSWLIHDLQPRIIRVCEVEQYIVLRHGRNTWNRMATGQTADEYLAGLATYPKPLHRLVPAADFRFYCAFFRWRNASISSSEIRHTPRP